MLIVVDQLGRGLSPSRRECGALSVKALSHFSRQSTTDMCQPITIGLPRLRHRAYKEAAIPRWGFAVPADHRIVAHATLNCTTIEGGGPKILTSWSSTARSRGGSRPGCKHQLAHLIGIGRALPLRTDLRWNRRWLSAL